jgi:DNA-directed RNA polymerase subunit alpha
VIPLPQNFTIISQEGHTATFQYDGLYPGYGITLGNALRRVLLSSIPGSAITSVKIKGVSHEFSTLPGILEDMLEISLNLKAVVLLVHGEDPQIITLKAKGKKDITAGDFDTPSQVEIISSDAHIATITDKDTTLEMELEVANGIGYEPVAQRKRDKTAIGIIPLDAIYSPIRKANFVIEDMRVGDRTDYNRLRIDIETDGTKTPQEVLAMALQILIEQYSFFAQAISETHAGQKIGGRKVKTEKNLSSDVLKTKIEELTFSTRTSNSLQEGGIKTVGGLTRKTKGNLLELEGMGDRGLEEVQKALKKLGLQLKEGE